METISSCPNRSEEISFTSDWDSTLEDILARQTLQNTEKHFYCAKLKSDLSVPNSTVSQVVTENLCRLCLEQRKDGRETSQVHEELLLSSVQRRMNGAYRHMLTLVEKWTGRASSIKTAYEKRIMSMKLKHAELTKADALKIIEAELTNLQLALEEDIKPEKLLARIKALGIQHAALYAKAHELGILDAILLRLQEDVKNGALPLDVAETYSTEAFPKEVL